LETLLRARLKEIVGLPAAFTASLESTLGRALDFAERVAREAAAEPQARRASSALYHAASAVLLAWEGARDPADARRALLSRFVLEHRLAPKDPLEPEAAAWEGPAIAALLEGDPVPLTRAAALLAG
jgi:acyl-CoA dehydrogenase